MEIVECVPNISEGRDTRVIDAVAAEVTRVPGVALLNVDPGAETNRTVFTFVGPGDAVLEAAFQLAARAVDLIDMRGHKGAHARIGAVDVVPFVPVSDVTMAQCVELARALGERIGRELRLPVYLYEAAATSPDRKNLADIRAGEYEGLGEKLKDSAWQPDFGPASYVARSGATVVGARRFLVAYNVNLNTRDRRLANRVAFDVREKGRQQRDENGEPIFDKQGEPVFEPGLLKSVKATGWSIPEFGCAQISMNLTDIDAVPLHAAFDACDERARARGLRVTGSEIVGMVPRSVLVDAGRHYLRRMGRSAGAAESALVHIAARSLGLGESKPFNAEERVIEYRIRPAARLASMTLRAFVDSLSSDSPTPGGGSVAALAGALGASLAAMVATVSHAAKGFEARKADLDRIAIEAQELKELLLEAVDADAAAFDQLLAAMRLAKRTPDEEAARRKAITTATARAIEVPLGVLEACPSAIELCLAVDRIGIAASRSDAGVGAQMARAAAAGAYQNVCINASGLSDKTAARSLIDRADRAWARVCELHEQAEAQILASLRAAVKT